MAWEVEGVEEEVAGDRENVAEEEEEMEWEREVLVGLRKREEEKGRMEGGVSVTWHLRREWWWWRDWRELVVAI
jgi:hypothetical protein